jgi:RNA polymerase sigma factor (sigma-70 family)
MDVRPRPDARDDAELVRAATAGDRGAFAAIYDRYADRLHDFCWSVLRDRDEAADATQDAFLVAAERLGQLRDPERLRPWLYAVARSQALRRARARSRLAPEEDMTDLPDPATGPEQAAQRADLRELVWSAAAGLSERDRALLDLHLRHGLEGADLGEAIGVEPAHAYVLLTRLRDQVERSSAPSSSPALAEPTAPTCPACWPTGTAGSPPSSASGSPATSTTATPAAPPAASSPAPWPSWQPFPPCQRRPTSGAGSWSSSNSQLSTVPRPGRVRDGRRTTRGVPARAGGAWRWPRSSRRCC